MDDVAAARLANQASDQRRHLERLVTGDERGSAAGQAAQEMPGILSSGAIHGHGMQRQAQRLQMLATMGGSSARTKDTRVTL